MSSHSSEEYSPLSKKRKLTPEEVELKKLELTLLIKQEEKAIKQEERLIKECDLKIKQEETKQLKLKLKEVGGFSTSTHSSIYFREVRNGNVEAKKEIVRLIATIVGEVKAPSINIDTASCLGQVVSYLQTLGASQKDYRTNNYGFITNYNSIIFFKSEICASGVKVYHSELVEFAPQNDNSTTTLGMKLLYSLINSSIGSIDNNGFYPDKPITLKSFIGHGHTSLVFETKNDKVAKICKNRDSLGFIDNEFNILNNLLNEQENIPKPILFSDGILIMDKYHPLSQKFRQIQLPKKSDCFKLIDLLKDIHSKGFCHRDIRPDNIMKTNDGKLILIDWGFTCAVNETPFFAGTISFCANDYLACILDQNTFIRPYRKEYDCESLLKTFCFWFDEDKIEILLVNRLKKAEGARNFWNNFNNLNYQTILKQLHNKNSDPYDVLKSFFIKNNID